MGLGIIIVLLVWLVVAHLALVSADKELRELKEERAKLRQRMSEAQYGLTYNPALTPREETHNDRVDGWFFYVLHGRDRERKITDVSI